MHISFKNKFNNILCLIAAGAMIINDLYEPVKKPSTRTILIPGGLKLPGNICLVGRMAALEYFFQLSYGLGIAKELT
jgi:hypothetical protein